MLPLWCLLGPAVAAETYRSALDSLSHNGDASGMRCEPWAGQAAENQQLSHDNTVTAFMFESLVVLHAYRVLLPEDFEPCLATVGKFETAS